MKIVAKSIRDRVALIQWRRERIWPALQSQETKDSGSPDKARGLAAPLQVQVTYHAQSGQPGQPESEEPEADQHLLPPTLPASVTSLACEYIWNGVTMVSCVLSPIPTSIPSFRAKQNRVLLFYYDTLRKKGRFPVSSCLCAGVWVVASSCKWFPDALALVSCSRRTSC